MPLSFLGFLLCVHWKRQKAMHDQQVVPLNRSTLSNSRRPTGVIRTSSGVSAFSAITKGRNIYHDGSLPSWKSPNCPHFPGLAFPFIFHDGGPGLLSLHSSLVPRQGLFTSTGKKGLSVRLLWKIRPPLERSAHTGERARRADIPVGMTVLERSQPTTASVLSLSTEVCRFGTWQG